MSYIKNLLVITTCCFAINLSSQSDFEGFGETAFALNHKVNNNYKINFSTKSRYYVYQDNNFNFENRQIDVGSHRWW